MNFNVVLRKQIVLEDNSVSVVKNCCLSLKLFMLLFNKNSNGLEHIVILPRALNDKYLTPSNAEGTNIGIKGQPAVKYFKLLYRD